MVTGASAGIGRTTALALAGAGASVVLGDVDADRGPIVAKELQAAGAEAVFERCDVSKPEDAHRLVALAEERFGGLDASEASTSRSNTPAPRECPPRPTSARWRTGTGRSRSTCPVSGTGCAPSPAMLRRGGGAIVNNSSVAGPVGFRSIPAYVGSKHGIVGLTKAAALEYAQQGVRVNAVYPGVIDTEMVQRFTHDDEAGPRALLEGEPIGPIARPTEIASCVLWLCSDESSFVTGQALAVDGGFVAQ